ncbi:MAG: PAS domain S-box protein, partial [Candidatus Doudnabacteria bacterium]|nr:PAS domain S-box protein [Candidatus Doudnabacteria bacterium]
MIENDPGIQSLEQKQTYSEAVNLFKQLADNAPVLIWMTGVDKQCNFLNKRWLEYTGRPLEEQLGNGWAQSLHPEDLETCWNLFVESFETRRNLSVRYRLLRNDGVYRWFQGNGSAFYLQSGEFAGYIGSSTDITDSISELTSLEHQNYLTKSITDNTTVCLFLIDQNNTVTFMNPAAEKVTGFSMDDIRGKNLHDVIHHTRPDGTPFPHEECFLDKALGEMRQTKDHENYYIRKNGQFFPALCSASPIIKDGRLVGAVLEVKDITEQKRSEEKLRSHEARFRALIENSSDAITLINMEGKVLYNSPSVRRVLGYNPNDESDRNVFDYMHPADVIPVMEEFKQLLSKPGSTVHIELRVRHADGVWRWLDSSSSNLLNDENVNAIVVNFRDVTEKKIAEEKALYQNYHDSLTDLPNRNYYTERLGTFIVDDKKKLFGVMLIDLDRFKMINESLGHSIGDRLIQEVSLRLANSLDESDMLARLGGDEYGIVLDNITKEEEIGQTCSRILEALKPAFHMDAHELYITPSIGISVYPYDGEDVSTLLKNADSA